MMEDYLNYLVLFISSCLTKYAIELSGFIVLFSIVIPWVLLGLMIVLVIELIELYTKKKGNKNG